MSALHFSQPYDTADSCSVSTGLIIFYRSVNSCTSGVFLPERRTFYSTIFNYTFLLLVLKHSSSLLTSFQRTDQFCCSFEVHPQLVSSANLINVLVAPNPVQTVWEAHWFLFSKAVNNYLSIRIALELYIWPLEPHSSFLSSHTQLKMAPRFSNQCCKCPKENVCRSKYFETIH